MAARVTGVQTNQGSSISSSKTTLPMRNTAEYVGRLVHQPGRFIFKMNPSDYAWQGEGGWRYSYLGVDGTYYRLFVDEDEVLVNGAFRPFLTGIGIWDLMYYPIGNEYHWIRIEPKGFA